MLAGGFYIGRYEAGGSSGNVTVKSGQTTYTYVTQSAASAQSQAMYSNSNYTSDLVNSLAWDTAIVYIQLFGSNSNYSNQIRLSSSKLTTGGAGDEQLKINDMASNVREWNTENASRSSYPCAIRGGYYSISTYTTAYRNNYSTTGNDTTIGFRPLIYVAL